MEIDEKIKKKVDIRIKKRNAKQSITTIEGLYFDIDFKKLTKEFKKRFCCNGTIIKDDKFGKIIQLQGDQRQNVYDFLIEEELYFKDDIRIHGF